MARTIGNPLSWTAQAVAGAGRRIGSTAAALGGESAGAPMVRRIGAGDLRAALRAGAADFAAFRTDVLFLAVIYPAAGLVLVWATLNAALLPLIFPLVSGFALVGPLAAVGLYELSRRREAGAEASWFDAFGFFGTPALGPVLVLGGYLLAMFVGWLVAAHWIWRLTLGPEPPTAAGAFATEVLTTPAGWAMIVVGIAVGFLFAAAVLAVSLVSFPMIMDRGVGLPLAVSTSLRVARENPRTVAAWGLIVAAALVLGTLPLLLGLVVVLPVLGHATWHLYRRAVAWPAA
jgi:uncharacterized membrane protein